MPLTSDLEGLSGAVRVRFGCGSQHNRTRLNLLKLNGNSSRVRWVRLFPNIIPVEIKLAHTKAHLTFIFLVSLFPENNRTRPHPTEITS